MVHSGSQLAIPEGYPAPTQLPGEFDSHVKVYEIVNSEFPGYVYLWLSYLLTECENDGKYKAVQCERVIAIGHASCANDPMHGPALLHNIGLPGVLTIMSNWAPVETRRSIDTVLCITLFNMATTSC